MTTNKEIAERREKLKQEIMERLKEKSRQKVLTPAPRYDDVFYQGVRWLDSL